ncbi:nitroreductase family protein [Fundidesulfovibrio agrisoli]|uniref:nitroreductase family protein n=1 Tax=Fundidesulfovibrio agrisoli TaxID=2922717 RepID=UPI001FADE370|nr:nitroreductase family protein [Fundidesulfovibrio agrisoli]
MELMKAMRTRRSIRNFQPTPVPQKLIESLLAAAIEAPSPKNAQPWRFVVVAQKSRDALFARIRVLVEEELAAGRIGVCVRATVRAMEEAPVFVLVYNRATARYSMEKDPVLARVIDVQSIGASIQNMLLAAQEKGLGTLWICDLLDVDPVLRLLQTEDELVAVIALGYPVGDPPRPPRCALADIVTWQTE